jgi:pimeloyl-ACP methyl ester carboxylesterase
MRSVTNRTLSRYVPGGTWTLAAAALAGAALANHLMARRAERRYPPEGRLMTVDGVRLHCLDRGSGPPVVLIHGNGSMADELEISGLPDLLARTHRVIAFDRPGFGHSSRPRDRVWTPRAHAALLAAALRQLDIHRPVLLGHSWGTLVALSMVLDEQVETQGLVLVSGFYVPRARADVALGLVQALPGIGTILRHTILPPLGWLVAGPVYRLLFAPSPVTAAFRERFRLALALRPSQLRAVNAETALMLPGAASLFPRCHQLAVPVVIAAGTGDRIVNTDRQSRVLHRKVANARLMTIAGGGHMIHHLTPDRIADAVRDLTGA